MDDWLERNRRLVLGLVGVAVVVPLVIIAIRWQRPPPITIEAPPPTVTEAAPTATPTPSPVTVYVSGAVRQPDVYTLPGDARVQDALEAAGGPTDEANLDAINLAAFLAEGQQIHVPVVGEVVIEGGEDEGTFTVVYPLNLNTATAAELETLPGIGPALAQDIIDHRETFGPFSEAWQIQNVSGIGAAKYEDLKDLITVE